MSDASKKRRHPNYTALLIALLLLANFLPSYWQRATQKAKMDYFTFWSVPNCESLGSIENIYSEDGQRELGTQQGRKADLPAASEKQKQVTSYVLRYYDGRIDATGTPFMYTVIGLLSGGDYDKDQMFYMVLSSICFIASVLILCYLLRLSLVPTLLIVTLLISSYEPLLSDLRVGNLNQFQLFVVAAFIWTMAKSKGFFHVLLAGIILGVGIMLKPNIAPILLLSVLLYVMDKEYERCLALLTGTCLGGLVSFLISILYFGKLSVWKDFVASLGPALGVSYPLEHGNYSLSTLVFRWTKTNLSIHILIILIAVFAILVWKTKRREASSVRIRDSKTKDALLGTVLVGGIGCAIMLLSSGLAWLHYYVLLVPVIVFVIRPTAQGDRTGRRRYAQIASIAPIVLLTTLPGFIFRSGPVGQCVKVTTATLALAGLAFYELWYVRRLAPPKPDRH
jgi:hypothetical protein